MQFQEIIGQQEVKTHLMEMVSDNRLSHALLFLGKEGAGGLPLAISFAKYIMCEKVQSAFLPAAPSLFGEETLQPAFPSDSCGQCPSCLKASQLVHPDIHFSYPVVTKKSGSKALSSDFAAEWREFVKQYVYGNVFDWLQSIEAENKQGNISADECNEISRKLSIKSFESGYKILILWMAEYLGKEGNKLLKIIEEPPADTLFIFVAENEDQILQTILSRTQLVRIPRLTTDDVREALEIRCALPPAQARQVANMSEGNYREALQQVNHASEDWMDLFRDWMSVSLRKNYAGQLKWVEEISKLGRERQKQFLKYCNHLLGQSIRAAILPGETGNYTEKELDFINRLNSVAGIPEQEAIVSELDNAAYYIERNANPKMLFHALTIKLYHIINDKSLILVN
jgi:DNA polymerase III subunit delta'